METRTDETFYIDKEEAPAIKACVLHPWVEASKTYVGEARANFAGVHYGLCKTCAELVEHDQDHRDWIEAEIDRRLLELQRRTQ